MDAVDICMGYGRMLPVEHTDGNVRREGGVMVRTNVFLARQGSFAGAAAAKGDYDGWIGIVQRLLEESVTTDVVSSWNNAVFKIINDGLGMENSVVVFFTEGMLSEAKTVKKTYPDLRVALLTGDPRELSLDHQGVLVFSKVPFDRDAVRAALLA